MAIDKPQFARTYLWVFAAHVAVIALVLSKPIGCSRESANGRTLASERPLFEEAVPHQLDLALSGTSGATVAAQALAGIDDPPSRLVLPETRTARDQVNPEAAREEATREEATREEAPTRHIAEDAVAPPPSKPETPKKETPEREPVKSEGKPETPKPRRTRNPDQPVPEKAESGKPPKSNSPAPAPKKPTESKPNKEAKPDKAAEKRPAQPRTAPVSTKKEANSEPPAVPAKVIDEPETVRARPVGAAAEQAKEILQAKPVLPATVVKEPISEGASAEIGRGESPAAAANMGAYQSTVRRMIRSRWNEPKGEPAAQMPEVLITISRDGSIVYSRLQRSSGNDVLDRSAMEAVRPRSQLPPLPSGYPDERYDLVIKFQLD